MVSDNNELPIFKVNGSTFGLELLRIILSSLILGIYALFGVETENDDDDSDSGSGGLMQPI